ncbi:AAA family ATPase [uncultured Pseudoalteromonas sp.]|uniref:ATP-binding protein n=1 Tax=uncultured Pseudoalteromonas sp. TaxID=114053 RepID=UPI000C501097|nr:AAA family ATPase [uncultured Pseudoalteromonas sp.]MBD55964.1 hypothetical protein [Pseudoalteromonas sp.]|tara:strand:- start:23325 stop:24116 length:792 start_codon:yes stop_codon:yes gene_type:complete
MIYDDLTISKIKAPYFTVGGYLERDIPAPEELLGDLFISPSLNMVAAGEGVGKSYLLLGMARAIATGTPFLNLEAGVAKRVLYIDGEMDPNELQTRLGILSTKYRDVDKFINNTGIISFSDFTSLVPDFTDIRWQNHFASIIEQHDVIMFDNLSSCLGETDLATDVKEVKRFINWCVSLRNQKGKSIFLVNHMTKTSKETMGVPQLKIFNNTNIELVRGEGNESKFVVTKCRHKPYYGKEGSYEMDFITVDGAVIYKSIHNDF